MLSFQKLNVWKKAIKLAVILVQIADSLPQKYQYSFGDRLRRSSLSIASNIAEGAERQGKRDAANFYSISRGSAHESLNIIILLELLHMIDTKKFDLNRIQIEAEEIVKMLFGLSKQIS